MEENVVYREVKVVGDNRVYLIQVLKDTHLSLLNSGNTKEANITLRKLMEVIKSI